MKLLGVSIKLSNVMEMEVLRVAVIASPPHFWAGWMQAEASGWDMLRSIFMAGREQHIHYKPDLHLVSLSITPSLHWSYTDLC